MTRYLLLFAVLLCAPAALADHAVPLGRTGAWESFVYRENGKVCYMVNVSRLTPGADLRRLHFFAEVAPHVGAVRSAALFNGSFVLIAHRPGRGRTDEVTVQFSQSLEPGSRVSVGVGAEPDPEERHFLFTDGKIAQDHDDRATNRAIVEALRGAELMWARGRQGRGRYVTDVYSLDGFAQAYAEIGRACGIKPAT